MTVLKNIISDVAPDKRKSRAEIEEAICRRADEFMSDADT